MVYFRDIHIALIGQYFQPVLGMHMVTGLTMQVLRWAKRMTSMMNMKRSMQNLIQCLERMHLHS